MSLGINRLFTANGKSAYDGSDFVVRTSEVSRTGQQIQVIAPSSWSQVAVDILAQKYLRRAGVPSVTVSVPEAGVPEWLLPRKAAPGCTVGGETDARAVFDRLARCWAYWGWKAGWFSSDQEACIFYDEIRYMLAHQMAAPNSPQWFNTGLHHAYGIDGPAQGHYYTDADGHVHASTSAYERPQPSACFIQSVSDDLVNAGGIMDLWAREARVFKYGGGSGSNFSALRGAGEPLTGGGHSSGVMSFLQIGDRAAGAIKSGGTTRRAAKMVCLDIDHPDVQKFINWKVVEEQKVAALVTGSRMIQKCMGEVFHACVSVDVPVADRYQSTTNPKLGAAIRHAREMGVPDASIVRCVQLAQQGYQQMEFETFDTDWQGNGYGTVSGQNSNNTVRLSDAFMQAVGMGTPWELRRRTDGGVHATVPARKLWNDIAMAAWLCADPGVHYSDTINDWHTCPESGSINASNPCSEYLFLDDTACNLASLNLLKFHKHTDAAACDRLNSFDFAAYKHAIDLWTLVLEISVGMGQYPSALIARNSYMFRTLGLGYANLGALLMVMGVPYDSEDGRAICATLTATLTGCAYKMSAKMAAKQSPFAGYDKNKHAMRRVMEKHAAAIKNSGIAPIWKHMVTSIWSDVLALGAQHGYRNAQVSVIAPTGTIGLVMDCDTTGVEPDYALVKFKKLAGGGYFKIVNESVAPALKQLGYAPEEIERILTYACGHKTLRDAPGINWASLQSRGLSQKEIDQIEAAIPSAFDLTTLLPSGLFTDAEIAVANLYACGAMTLEGAPGLCAEHLSVFDCASRCGRIGTRMIATEAHIDMMAACQPFVSGAISKTINMPNEATVEDIKAAYRRAYQQGLKAVAVYRDGSKLSQPLSSGLSDVLFTDVPPAPPQTEQVMKAAKEVTVRYLAQRRRLPNFRRGYTQKAVIGGHKVFLRTGEYEDGTLGEIFVDMNKEGSAYRSLMNSFAIAISIGLQHGVPLEKYVDQFTFTRFEPNGIVSGHDRLKIATSVIDYMFRDVAIRYLGRQDLAHVALEEDVEDGVEDTSWPEPEEEPVQANVRANKPERATVSGGTATPAPRHAHREARAKGYEGDACPDCGALTMVRNGTCLKCVSCGATSGCS